MPRGSIAPQGAPRLAPTGETSHCLPRPELVHDAAHQRRDDRRALSTPSRWGQAVPDPLAREGRESRAGAVGSTTPGSSTPTVGCRGFAALVVRRARQRFAPTGVGGASPVGHPFAKVGGRPCCRGQALPNPLAWQGRQSPSGALVTVPRGSPRRPIHVTGAAAPQGDGRGIPRPCTGWASIPSRVQARRGSAVRCLPSAL